MSRRSERLWRGFAVLAASIYLMAIFAPWHATAYKGKSWLAALAQTFTAAHGAWASVLGIAALALCYLILVFALLGPRRSALSLERHRTVLASSLALLTTFFVLTYVMAFGHSSITERSPSSPFVWGVSFHQAGYGAWAALGSSLALLLAVAVLDADGLGGLLDRLPAWVRLDRLQSPEDEAGKPVVSPAERGRRVWTPVMILALIVYTVSLLMSWWDYSIPSGDLGGGGGGWYSSGLVGIGEFCALAALATVVTAYLTRSGRADRLERLRNALVAALCGLTLVNVLVLWRHAAEPISSHSRPDWGALTGVASIVVILVATFALNAGRPTRLIGRTTVYRRSEHAR